MFPLCVSYCPFVKDDMYIWAWSIALLVLLNRAMRETSKGGTSGLSSSTSFFMPFRLILTAESGAIGNSML